MAYDALTPGQFNNLPPLSKIQGGNPVTPPVAPAPSPAPAPAPTPPPPSTPAPTPAPTVAPTPAPSYSESVSMSTSGDAGVGVPITIVNGNPNTNVTITDSSSSTVRSVTLDANGYYSNSSNVFVQAGVQTADNISLVVTFTFGGTQHVITKRARCVSLNLLSLMLKYRWSEGVHSSGRWPDKRHNMASHA